MIIAHRGESRDAPENTLGSIQLAWDRGAAAVELDVRLTRDEEVVVVHDPDLRRIGGSPRIVARSTAAELRTCDIGSWKHRRWSGERVPLLREVLATVPRGGCLFVEIKVGPEIVPALGAVLQAHGPSHGRIVLMSFNRETMAAVARVLPRYEACLLLTARHWLGRGGAITAAIDAARRLGCVSLDVEVHRQLNASCIDAVHSAGMSLYTWTVNRVATTRRLAAAGIDGITTDRCAWMQAQLAH